MSAKQDRQAPRTATQIERKHQKVLSGKDEATAKLNAQIEELNRMLGISDDATKVAISQLKVRVGNLETSVESLLQFKSDAEEYMTANDAIVNGLVDKVYALETAVGDLTERLTTAETALASLETRVKTLEGNGE